MTFKLLTEHHLAFLSLTESHTGSCESTRVKLPHCWKSHVTVHLFIVVAPITLVNVYVDLLVVTRIAGTSKTGSGRY